MSDDHRWFKRFRRPAVGTTTLLCLHHAGGNAAMFREWARLLPESIDPVAVQLPGRADRFNEPLFYTMENLVDNLVEVTEPLLYRPFAVFGASMGARVGWSFGHALRERGLPMPRALYVSASSAPSLDRTIRGWDGLDEDLVHYMRTLGGTPAQLLDDPELRDGIVATLRADLTVLSTHTYQPDELLAIPITAFAGVNDEESPPRRMRPWGAETTGSFVMNVINGGHFLDSYATQLVVDAIVSDLR